MVEALPITPREWESFYVIVGSSAGALTGLQFVVLTLITEGGMIRGTGETLSAFGTPNVVHFCAALLVSAILSAPWHGMAPAGVAVGLTGAAGFIYSIVVMRRASRQRAYKPVLEDWVWHAVLPLLAYAALVHAGIQLMSDATDTLFIVGGASLLLVFIGIHNAWDTVTYVMFERARMLKAQADAATNAEPAPAAANVAVTEGPAGPPGPPPATGS